MAILSSKPSRSYAQVEHDPDGLSAVGTAPFGVRQHGFKTYKPPLAETHLRRPGMYDSHPSSSFAPLPSAFNLSQKQRKDQLVAGQRAEVEHLLEPEFKSVSNYSMDDDASTSGPSSSRRNLRTAGGLGLGKSSGSIGLGLRSTASLGNFKAGNGSSSALGGAPGGGKKSNLGGVYMDAKGKIHDTEYDPFKGISEMSRKKSRRRSAFGGERRKGSDAESTSTEGSEAMERFGSGGGGLAGGSDYGSEMGKTGSKDEEETRKRLEIERRRLDEVSGFAAARRKSIISQRSDRDGRATPSIRSSDDGRSHGHGQQTNGYDYSYGYPFDRANGRSKSSQGSQGGYVPSLLSPTFSQPSTTSQTKSLPTVEDSEEMPIKSTEITRPTRPPTSRTHSQLQAQLQMPPPPAPVRKEKVEMKAGTKKVTGFDAPSSPMPPVSATMSSSQSTATAGTEANHSHLDAKSLHVPRSAHLSSGSRASRNSSETSREPRTKPAPRAREDLFPETPAQAKRREERERRAGLLAGGGGRLTPMQARSQGQGTGRDSVASPGPGYSYAHRTPGLAIDSQLASSGRGRLLPEIEIVEDDDPRIVFPAEGRSTRIQTKHDHVIRSVSASTNPGPSGGGGGSTPFNPDAYRTTETRRPSSARSISLQNTQGSGRDPSEILDQGPGGYLPSRWAKGDKELRVTEGEREKYRPMEWGGKKGELGGKPAEWKPTTKEAVKKEWKDFQTNARFSLFRASKKLERKTDF